VAKSVALIAHGDNVSGVLRIWFDLPAQSVDMHGEEVPRAAAVVPPERAEQVLMGDDLVGVGYKEVKEAELNTR
jgi:hypothetical protein